MVLKLSFDCLTTFIADSIDTESLNQALAPLGAVYSRLTGLQQLWYTVSAMMRRVQLDTKSKRVFTQADTEEHVTKLLKSLGQMDAVRNKSVIC